MHRVQKQADDEEHTITGVHGQVSAVGTRDEREVQCYPAPEDEQGEQALTGRDQVRDPEDSIADHNGADRTWDRPNRKNLRMKPILEHDLLECLYLPYILEYAMRDF